MKTWCLALCVLFAGMVNILAEDKPKPVTSDDVAPGKVVVCIPPADFKNPDECTLYEKDKCPWKELVDAGKAFTVYVHPDDFENVMKKAFKDHEAAVKAKGGRMAGLREKLDKEGKKVRTYIAVEYPLKK